MIFLILSTIPNWYVYIKFSLFNIKIINIKFYYNIYFIFFCEGSVFLDIPVNTLMLICERKRF